MDKKVQQLIDMVGNFYNNDLCTGSFPTVGRDPAPGTGGAQEV